MTTNIETVIVEMLWVMEDPMWANHVELNKKTLQHWVDLLRKSAHREEVHERLSD